MEPQVSRREGIMPTLTNLPHRAIRNVLFTLFALIGFQAYGQFDFSKSIDIAWNEQDGLEGATGGTSLANLNSRVDVALGDATATTLCYVISGTPSNALTFNASAASCSVPGKAGKRSVSPNWLALKSGQHVDYERGAKQLLTITGYDSTGKEQSKFEINLIITDYDERPLLLQQASQVKTWYWRPDDSDRLLISDLFRDPDGAPVRFDPSDVSSDVWICDTANGGDFTIEEVPNVPARAQAPGSPITFTGGDAAANCSVSNQADVTSSPAPDPNPGVRGTAGNRVLTTKTIGPFLEITADSLADDTDGDGTVTDRGSGTYFARVFFRAWSGPSDPPLSSTGFASVNVFVRVGVNNPPQFGGGASGFSVTLTEGNDETDPMPAWVAGDLDAGGTTNDTLTYGLSPSGGKSVSVAGGSITLKENRGDNPATTAVETDFLLSLALMGRALNYESKQTSFEIGLYVSDIWSDPVRVPIQVTLTDVNEIVIRRPIDDQRLINGMSTKIDLTQFYSDPEGDIITYKAYTNQYFDVVEVDNDTDELTIHGKYARKGEGGESTVRVTLLATDSQGLEAVPLEFDVTTRYENLKPSIDVLKGDTRALGTSIFEAGSAGTVLMPLIEYTDDAPSPTTVFNGEPLFRTIVDPNVKDGELCAKGSKDCVEHAGSVAIVVGNADLNFEAMQSHVLSLALRDAWQPELVSDAIEFQVFVNDSNDAPTVVSGSQIADQNIVVYGSDSYRAGDHFTDEDGDRLRINATSSNDKIVEVNVSGLDHVLLKGIKEGQAQVTLTAVDPEGATAELAFSVTVGPNNPPVVNEEALAAQLPKDNVLSVAGFTKIALDEMFSEPDNGDEIVSVTAHSSDESVLLAIPTDKGNSMTLVGRKSGTATFTVIATDRAGNETSAENEIVVNAPPVEVTPLDPITLDRTTPHVVDVGGVFADPDHSIDELVITASTVEEDIELVTLEVIGTQLTISGIMGASPGDAEIQLTATDPHGLAATSTFVATVINIGPTVAMPLEAQELDRINPRTLDLSGVFDDADGEIQSITVTIADMGVVETNEIDETGMLTITGLTVGSTTITLTATDDNDAYTMLEFDVTVINIEPRVAEPISDQKTTRIEDIQLDISTTFDDPDADNDMLSFAVVVEDDQYVSATLDGTMLALKGLDVGTTLVTLTATDADDGSVDTTFLTTIENINPSVVGSISPISLEVGGQATTQSIANLFDDDDPLTYTVTIADSNIAAATLSGLTVTIQPLSRGSTSLTVTALDPHGARAIATGSITVGDGQIRAVAEKSLASFGRALIASVSSSVGSRVMSDQRPVDLTLDSWAPVDKQNSMSTLSTSEQMHLNRDIVHATTLDTNSMMNASSGVAALRSMLGQKFALNLGTSANPSPWAVWGSVDLQSYEGDGYDGMSSSVYLGADVTVASSWIFGVALSSNSGESDYSWGTATQTMDLNLATMLPYVRFRPNDRTSMWGVVGFGSGELETSVVGAANDVSFLDSRLTLVGGSQELKRGGRLNLALHGDVASVSLETDAGDGAADGLTTDVSRVRLGLESSLHTATGQGGILEPFGQFNLRSDGGDGETGTGIEIVGGVRISSSKFSLEAHGRKLATHAVDGYSESGFSLMAKLNPSGNATGVLVSIAPRWGADALGSNVLWQDTMKLTSAQAYGPFAGVGNSLAKRSIDAQVAYGMLIIGESYLLTPFVDVALSDEYQQKFSLGTSLRHVTHQNANFNVNLALGFVREHTGATSATLGINSSLSF